MAKSISAPFIECSASDGVNIDVAFRELVKLVRKDERVSPSFSPTIMIHRPSSLPLEGQFCMIQKD